MQTSLFLLATVVHGWGMEDCQHHFSLSLAHAHCMFGAAIASYSHEWQKAVNQQPQVRTHTCTDSIASFFLNLHETHKLFARYFSLDTKTMRP